MKEVIMQAQSFSVDYPKAPIYVGNLVRCKDCKHWQDQEEGVVESAICVREKPMVMEIGPHGYCSYGERRSK